MLAILCLAGFTSFRDGFPYRRGSNPFADVATASLGAGKELTEARCLISPDEVGDRYFCLSDKRGPASILLWGDSMSEALYYGQMSSSSEGHRWSLVGRWACPPFLEGEDVAPRTEPACLRIKRAVIQALARDSSIETVVLTFGFGFLFPPAGIGENATNPYETQLDATVSTLLGLGKRVVITMDNPELPDPRRCMDRAALGWPPVRWLLGMDRNASQVTRCDRPLADHLAETQAYRATLARVAARHPEVVVYDPTSILCDVQRGVCPIARDGRYLYSYGDHMSDSASSRIAKELLPLVENPTRKAD